MSSVSDEQVSERARAFGGAIEPFAGQVYFSPECHGAYAALGFERGGRKVGGVESPDGPAYFCSRGSVMGQVPGELIAAAFGVFNPEVVVPSVDFGWQRTDAQTICQARQDGAVAQLARILGDEPAGIDRVGDLLARAAEPLRPEGRPLYAGILAREVPQTPLARSWFLSDLLREYRGDSHTAAYVAGGFDATEIGMMTELFWGLPLRTYVRTRGWTDAQLDAAEARLIDRGLVADGAFTDAGRAAREAVEVATDAQCRPIIEALSADFDELVSMLLPWGQAIRDGGGYLASGPHDLARANS